MSTTAFDDDDDDDGSHILSDGPASVVTRIEPMLPDTPRFVAVKTATTAHAKEPHDIVKEVRLLAALAHPNIIPLIRHQHSPRSQNLSFWMPYIPHALDALLQSSRFSPHPIISFAATTSSSLPTLRELEFVVLAKSIVFQILYGIAYLHSERVQIAHRDIKPPNVLLTPTGRVQLIDFGIAFPAGEGASAKASDLWPESAARMYFEVSTGPYRAPELLFGARTYDAFAVDAWSLGVTLSEFFTSLRLHTGDEYDGEDLAFTRPDSVSSESASSGGVATAPGLRPPTPPPMPFIIPRVGAGSRPEMPSGRWTRTSLFDGTRGEIGLAWSIFKVRGTPAQDSWPSFLTLPDAKKLTFVAVDAVDLSTLLPNLPPSSCSASPTDTRTHFPSSTQTPTPLDLVHRFLVYEPSRRLRPSEALLHPWFTAEPGLVLPSDLDHIDDSTETGVGGVAVAHTFTLEGKTRMLDDLLQTYVLSQSQS